jgi:hypothetical protein
MKDIFAPRLYTPLRDRAPLDRRLAFTPARPTRSRQFTSMWPPAHSSALVQSRIEVRLVAGAYFFPWRSLQGTWRLVQSPQRYRDCGAHRSFPGALRDEQGPEFVGCTPALMNVLSIPYQA